jgi:predicted ester cyclase
VLAAGDESPEVLDALGRALWLSREYALVWRNDAAANGWLARAERLLGDVAPGAEAGWRALARSERTADSTESVELAEAAVATAVRAGDADLELRALAQLGLAEVSRGEVDAGLGHLDEAMAAATGRRAGGGLPAAFPDMHASIEELIAERDKVVCRGIFTGTQDAEIKGIAPTGRPVSLDFGEIYRVKDGHVVSYWCQMDVAGLMHQLTEDPALASAMG